MKSQMVVTGASKKRGVAARVVPPSWDRGLAYFDFSRVVYIKGELKRKGGRESGKRNSHVRVCFAFLKEYKRSKDDLYTVLNWQEQAQKVIKFER